MSSSFVSDSEEGVPPPLPPRQLGSGSAGRELPPLPPREVSRELPPLPSRKTSNGSNPLSPSSTFSSETAATNLNTINSTTYNYDLSDNLSTILILRQFEVYSTPSLNEVSDYLTVNKSLAEELKAKFDSLREQNPEDSNILWEFWARVVSDYRYLISSRNFQEVESVFIEGIPNQLRSIIYPVILRVNSTLSQPHFNVLLDKSRSSNLIDNQNSYYESLGLDKKICQVLNVFNSYISKASRVTTTTDIAPSQNLKDSSDETSSAGLLPSNFIINICKLILDFDDITEEEAIPILLKWHRLFENLIKEEFFYKINRAFEDNLSLLFIHLTKQGVNLSDFYKVLIFNFFSTKIFDTTILLKILDVTLIEGFDFLIRVILYVFDQNSDDLSKLQYEKLTEYMSGEKFFRFAGHGFKFSDVLKYSPNIIKYENEYHLMHNNSLNLNENELIKLKEVNDDLRLKITELSTNFETLNNSHLQILEENRVITSKQTEVLGTNESLNKRKSELLSRIRTLDMHEEITYTVKRNEEIELLNEDLQAQIDEIKQSLEAKKEKLAQYETSSV